MMVYFESSLNESMCDINYNNFSEISILSYARICKKFVKSTTRIREHYILYYFNEQIQNSSKRFLPPRMTYVYIPNVMYAPVVTHTIFSYVSMLYIT